MLRRPSHWFASAENAKLQYHTANCRTPEALGFGLPGICQNSSNDSSIDTLDLQAELTADAPCKERLSKTVLRA